jgi:hypothetical protein
MSLINTVSSSKPQGHRPWKCWFWNVCFLEVVLLENCRPTLSAWKPPPSFRWQNKCHIHTANISRQCSYLACVDYACCSSVYLWPSLPLRWNRSPFMDQTVIGMWAQLPPREHVVITGKRFRNAETLCEEIDLKFSKCRKKIHVNFLSNIF